MPVKLYTRDGGFVHAATIPPMQPPPEVLVWGSRVFVRGLGTQTGVALELDHTVTLVYTEAFAFTLFD